MHRFGDAQTSASTPTFAKPAVGNRFSRADARHRHPPRAVAVTLDALVATQSLGDVRIKGNQSQTYNATVPGGLNVLDFDRLRTGNKATITLDGAGDPDSAFVIRVDRKLDIRFQSQIVLANGASAERAILYGRSKCKIGIEVVGAGTVVCPEGKLLLAERTDWEGALMGGRKIVQLKQSGVLTRAPLQIGQ